MGSGSSWGRVTAGICEKPEFESGAYFHHGWQWVIAHVRDLHRLPSMRAHQKARAVGNCRCHDSDRRRTTSPNCRSLTALHFEHKFADAKKRADHLSCTRPKKNCRKYVVEALHTVALGWEYQRIGCNGFLMWLQRRNLAISSFLPPKSFWLNELEVIHIWFRSQITCVFQAMRTLAASGKSTRWQLYVTNFNFCLCVRKRNKYIK